MGSLRVSLNISSQDVLSTAVLISPVKTMTADGGYITKAKLAATSAGVSAMTLYKANDKLVSAYIYVKNIDPELENFVYMYNDANDDVVLKLGGGEFAFMPVMSDQDFKLYGTKQDQLVEFAVFGLDSSSVTLG